jgi:hypothetical protein
MRKSEHVWTRDRLLAEMAEQGDELRSAPAEAPHRARVGNPPDPRLVTDAA